MRDWQAEVRRRLAGAQLDAATEAQVAEELAQHLEEVYQAQRARGEDEAAAAAAALAELEGGAVLAERVRRTVRARPEPLATGAAPARPGLLSGLGSDARHAARALSRTPAFTLITALLIALGIAVNTVIFSVVNSVLLRPLPGVRDADRLASIYTSDFSGPRYGASSYPDFEAFTAAGDVFAAAAAYTPRIFSVSDGGRGRRLMGEAVSHRYFETLGVRPQLGRTFGVAEQGSVGGASAVVISHGLWQRSFGGARDVIGAPLRVNGQSLTVVGVAPEEYRGALPGTRVDLWVPLSAPGNIADLRVTERGDRGLFTVVRLRQDVDLAAAQARLNVVAAQLHAAYPSYWTDVNEQPRVVTLLPESESRVPPQLRTPVLGFFALLMAVVAIVLLIACANVANLMLSRASARRGEMGVRLALGATRGRIVRHLLTESLVLAALGGVAGVLLAAWLLRALAVVRLPLPVPLALDVPMDLRVLLFAAAITILVGVLFGILPALQASRSPAPLLREAATRVTRLGLRNGLVVVQIAGSLVLLVAGSLFLRSLLAAHRVDPGFDTENMVLVPFDLETEGFTPAQSEQFYGRLLERGAALPGVRALTLAERVPLGLGSARRGIQVEGYQAAAGEDMEFPMNGVLEGYFETMGIRLVQGRTFSAADRAGAPPVAIVNQAFARRFWPGRNPLGQRFSMSGPEGYMEVIGVVPDGKYRALNEPPTPYYYYPYRQWPAAAMTLHLRTAESPGAVVPALRAELGALAPGMPLPELTTLRQHVGLTTLPQRIAGMMLAALGALGVVIAMIGLYGVIAYAVAQRTREFGIRMALGALAGDVQRMVLAQGMRITALALLAGGGVAAAVAWLIRSLLLVAPFDPATFVVVPLALAGAAAFASWLPARRATRADPVAAIRAE